MNTDYPEKFENTLKLIEYKLSDVTSSLDEKSKSDSRYRIIPTTKKGKHFLRFNALDMQTHESITIFLSEKTLGVKLHDKDGNTFCDYSVSRNGNKQIIQINYSDGTSISQSSSFNQETHEYDIQDTTVLYPTADLVDINKFSGDIINDKLYTKFLFNTDIETLHVNMAISFTSNPTSNVEELFYGFDKYEELVPIVDEMKEDIQGLVDSYTRCIITLNNTTCPQEIITFSKSFRAMLKEMERKQKNESDFSDPTTTSR